MCFVVGVVCLFRWGWGPRLCVSFGVKGCFFWGFVWWCICGFQFVCFVVGPPAASLKRTVLLMRSSRTLHHWSRHIQWFARTLSTDGSLTGLAALAPRALPS